MFPSIKQVLGLTIGISTLANALIISGDTSLVGMWGLMMQLVYSLMLARLPSIDIRSVSFMGLCAGLYIHNCLWSYYIPHPSAEQVVLLVISVWMAPFFMILLGAPSKQTSDQVIEADLECGVKPSSIQT